MPKSEILREFVPGRSLSVALGYKPASEPVPVLADFEFAAYLLDTSGKMINATSIITNINAEDIDLVCVWDESVTKAIPAGQTLEGFVERTYQSVPVILMEFDARARG